MNELKVVQEGSFKPSCTIKLDNVVTKGNDFVAVLWDIENQQATLLQNADEITMSYAFLLVFSQLQKMYRTLNESGKQEVDKTFPGIKRVLEV